MSRNIKNLIDDTCTKVWSNRWNAQINNMKYEDFIKRVLNTVIPRSLENYNTIVTEYEYTGLVFDHHQAHLCQAIRFNREYASEGRVITSMDPLTARPRVVETHKIVLKTV